jgi:two-component system OmpR family sensor kinase
MTIRSRLAAAYGAGVILALLVVGFVVWWEMGAALRSSLDVTLQTRAAGVLTALENSGQAGLQEPNGTAAGTFTVLFAADSSVIDSSSNAPAGIRPVDGTFDAMGRHYVLRVQVAPDGTKVVTGADLQPIADSQAALARLLLGVGIAVAAVSLLGGWLLAARALRPVDRLIADAATLGPGDLGRRLGPPVRMDEVGKLTATLNGMLDRIADSVERQRLFVAMASHQLRTPLAALRSELDIADRDDASPKEYRDALHEAQGDAVRLASLTTSLLELARTGEDAGTIAPSPVSLTQLVSGVARTIEPIARRSGVALDLDVPDVVVRVDRARVEHALGNLVENAIVHGRSGGVVELRVRVDGAPWPQTLAVEVLDRGPGLGSDSAAELFEPFRRGSRAEASGSGLGLATVASAVRAHGGTFGATNRAGGGARFWFTVPCWPVEEPAAPLPGAADRYASEAAPGCTRIGA